MEGARGVIVIEVVGDRTRILNNLVLVAGIQSVDREDSSSSLKIKHLLAQELDFFPLSRQMTSKGSQLRLHLLLKSCLQA